MNDAHRNKPTLRTESALEKELAPPGWGWLLFLIVAAVIAIAFLAMGLRSHYRLLQEKEQWKGEAAARKIRIQSLDTRITELDTMSTNLQSKIEAGQKEYSRIEREITVRQDDRLRIRTDRAR